MPTIYLSPSTQESNIYVSGGSEEYWMNLLADELEPWLTSSGIKYVRNTPQMTAASSIRASNAGKYDFHLALHSNAAPEGKYGTARGIVAFYAPNSVKGRRAALLIADNLRSIYPLPDRVRAETTSYLGEVLRTKAPAVLAEIGYHDNAEDARWITSSLAEIAEKLALSMTEYFGLPLVPPQAQQTGKVVTSTGNLNIRSRPDILSTVIASAQKGAVLTVLGQRKNWYTVNYNGTVGFASADYIDII